MAVVLAGGKGTRLHPFTITFPKPLVPLGEKPVLDRLLKQLSDGGISRAVISLGHLSSLVKAYLQQQYSGQDSLNISFIEESSPLGTAGPLALLRDIKKPFFVMNGDLLTDLNFQDLMNEHIRSGAVLTVARTTCSQKIDLGVLTLNEAGMITDYTEKPKIDYEVSMGAYVYSPEVLDEIPKGEYLDFPDLVKQLLKKGKPVGTYRHDGFWLDIGNPSDYAKAQQLVAEGRPFP